MLITLIQLFVTFIVYGGLVYLTHQATEVYGMPKWLDFKPFSCWKCLLFWSQVFTHSIIYLLSSFTWHITFALGLILAILTALAMFANENDRTLTEEDLNKL